MVIFRNRIASVQDIVLVFASCVAPVHSWAILVFFKQMPGWLFYLNAWDVISIFAYTQAFALLESAVVLLVLILLSAILPARFLRDRFVAQGSIVALLTSGWAIGAQCAGIIPFTRSAPWYSKRFFLGAVLYLASIGVSYLLLHRYKRLEESVNSFMERLTVLLYVYVPMALLSFIIVILRNSAKVTP